MDVAIVVFSWDILQADRYDVAVLRLDRKIDYLPHIRPICLPDKGSDFQGQYAWATGWGALEAGNFHSLLPSTKTFTHAIKARPTSRVGNTRRDLYKLMAELAYNLIINIALTFFVHLPPSSSGSRLRPKTLQAVDVPVLESRDCEGWHKGKGINVIIYDEMMCAGYQYGGKDSCQVGKIRY